MRVTFTDDAGNPETLTSEGIYPVMTARENTPAAGPPTISGTPQVGQTLTASASGIADADGLDNVTYAYTWSADSVAITAASYPLTSNEQGKAITVTVAFTDDAGNEESLTSAATDAVAPPPTPLNASIHDAPESHDGKNSFTFELRFSETPEPDFSYETLRDHAFTATGGTVTNAQRIEPPGNVRWEITVEPSSDADVTIVLPVTTDCDDQGAICTEDGRMLSAEAALTVAGPEEEEERTPPENNPATGAPAISGTAQVGETLTASTSGISDEDGLDNVSYAYQWLADDADIAGATGATHTLTSSEQGKAIKVRVSFTDDNGNAETLTSGATAAVEPAGPTEPPPAPTNLTYEINDAGHVVLSWTAPDDDHITGYRILRRMPRQNEDTLLVYVPDTGSNATTYTDEDVQAGELYVYRVKAINAAGVGPRSNYVNAEW